MIPETVEILDGALKSKRIEVTRQSLQAELETALRRGVTTSHAGGFFFIPYLMELGLYGALGQLSAPKTTGIPTEKIALQLIWEPIFGYVKGIRSVDPISQADFGLLSGLPFICSVSTEYRFLVESTIELKKDKLHIDIYGFQHRDVVAPLFQGLEEKLAAQNIDPRCPWLNDYALGFSFK